MFYCLLCLIVDVPAWCRRRNRLGETGIIVNIWLIFLPGSTHSCRCTLIGKCRKDPDRPGLNSAWRGFLINLYFLRIFLVNGLLFNLLPKILSLHNGVLLTVVVLLSIVYPLWKDSVWVCLHIIFGYLVTYIFLLITNIL